MRCGRDGQALRAAYPRGKGTLNLMPVGANMMIEPLLKSPSNRLPAVSKARAKGPFSPEAKALLVPLGANLKTVPLPLSDSNRLPALSKARPAGKFSPEAKVLLVPSA